MTMSYFNGNSTSASIVEVVFSVGLLFGSLILSKWGGTRNRIYTIVGSFLLMSFSLFVSGILPPDGFYVFTLCSWLMGVSGPFYWGMYTPLLQSNFEAKYLGRVLSLSSSIRLLSGPLGLVVSGIYAERYGVEKWFLIAGVLVLVASLLCVAVLQCGFVMRPGFGRSYESAEIASCKWLGGGALWIYGFWNII